MVAPAPERSAHTARYGAFGAWQTSLAADHQRLAGLLPLLAIVQRVLYSCKLAICKHFSPRTSWPWAILAALKYIDETEASLNSSLLLLVT